MKKLFLISAGVLCLCVSFAAGAFASTKIDLIINGKTSSAFDVRLIDGSAYIPVKALGELKNIKYYYNNQGKFITIYDNNPAPLSNAQANSTNNEVEAAPKIEVNRQNLTTAAEIKTFLESDFSELNTSIGTTKFTFTVVENRTTLSPYDFWIQVNFDPSFFNTVEFGNTITEIQRETVKSELKNHMESLGRALIKAAPSKKLYGNYYRSWYRYPNIKVDLITRTYFTWQNFDGDITTDYRKSSISSFRWNDSIDDKL